MRVKRFFLCILSGMLLAGCRHAGNMEVSESGTTNSAMETMRESIAEDYIGISLERLEPELISQVYDPMKLYSFCGLYFDGEMYISEEQLDASYTDKEDAQMPDMDYKERLGEEIGTVYGNNMVYWSMDSSRLQEVTETGRLYCACGYEKEYRVCIVYTYEDASGADVQHFLSFKRINGLTLKQGYELLQVKMHLEQMENIEIYIGRDRTLLQQCSYDEIMDGETMAALFKGIFMKEDEAERFCQETIPEYSLIFSDENGFKETLMVYENGVIEIEDRFNCVCILTDEQVTDHLIERVSGCLK